MILARRGYTEPGAARRFLAADERHDPDELSGMETAGGTVLGAIGAGRRITVYGDFDADGVCATAILVGAIRDLGGSCDWFIPDRIADGYGLNPDAIRNLAARGTELVLTVDCGVTAVEEVALARELGMEIVVTDHHQPDAGSLPDCPILHPELCGYPFPSLCGAAVAAKLATWLRRRSGAGTEGSEEEQDLDLVALATVADVMPLTGENRRLVREGLAVAARARRPGMAALLEECRVTPTALEAGDLGFRLAPRINAAGRMYRADAGVELFLSDSAERAGEIARELTAANLERRRVERQVFAEAEKMLASAEDIGPAIVVSGEGWHPGVVGIVASRLVKEHGRPSVVISRDGDHGRGSARSVPGLDLHAALGDTAGELLGFGGHAAAAGIQIEAAKIEPFRQALGKAVENRIGVDPVQPDIRFDAVAGGEDLGLDLAEELARLGPFGAGNPPVSLLIPGALVSDLREMGEGKHCRFTIESGNNRASGVCFGKNSLGVAQGERTDLIAELGLNHWNGSVSPRLVVRESAPLPSAEELPSCGPEEWWDRFERALEEGPGILPPGGEPGKGADRAAGRETVRGEGLPGVRIGELVSSGSRLMIVTADAPRRWRAFGGSAGLGRFNPGARVEGLWEGSPTCRIRNATEPDVLLTDYATLTRIPPAVIADFPDVVLFDPPAGPADPDRAAGGKGRLHLIAGPDEYEFAVAAVSWRYDPTADLRALYRSLRDAGAIDDGPGATADELRSILAGPDETPRSPERAALLVAVLGESGLLRESGVGAGRVLGVVSSVKVELSVSAVFGGQITQHKERIEFLRRSQKAR